MRATPGLEACPVLAASPQCLLLLVAIGGPPGSKRFTGCSVPMAPRRRRGTIMPWRAGINITATAPVIHARRRVDPNIRGAFLHMAADALVSLAWWWPARSLPDGLALARPEVVSL